MTFGTVYCGDTGEICDKLRELRTPRVASAQRVAFILDLAASDGLVAEPHQAEFGDILEEGMRRLELVEKAGTISCVETCALADVNVPKYLSSRSSIET